MDTSLEWKKVVGGIRFTCGNHTVGEEEEEEDHNSYGSSK